MDTCTIKDWLHSMSVGFGLAVVLLAIGYGAVMLTCAATESILPSASRHTDQRTQVRSVILAAAPASLPAQ